MSDIDMTDRFEVVYADSPESLIKAGQIAVLNAITKVIAEMEKDLKQPGLTWDQIKFLLDGFKKKNATIITREEPM